MPNFTLFELSLSLSPLSCSDGNFFHLGLNSEEALNHGYGELFKFFYKGNSENAYCNKKLTNLNKS